VTGAPQDEFLWSECSPVGHRQMHRDSTFCLLSTQARHPAAEHKVMSELKGYFVFQTGIFFLNWTSSWGISLSWRGSGGFTLRCL